MSRIITRLLPLLSISRNRISRLVLFRCALALAVVATAALPERANAQGPLFATSKNICIGIPDPINNNPNTCPLAPIVGVGQPVFYVIKVTNPPGQPQQNITLTENSVGSSTGYPKGFVPGAIVCTDQSGATITVAINGPTIGPFNLPLDSTVTCTIAGTFDNTAVGLQTNTADVDNREGPVQKASVQTTVATTTQLNTDLAVTKSVSPSPINVTNGPQIVTYTVTINRNGVGPNPLNLGQWFKLHDTLALLPNSVSLYATLITTPGSFSCMSTTGTDCLDPAGPTPTPPGQQLIGTMAPHSIFDWGFAPGTGNIAPNGTITLKFQVKIEKLPNLSCVKSLTSNGLNNQVFFTLTDLATGTAANDSNNANNTASAPLTVNLAGTVNPNCGAGQLTMTKTQVIPPPATQVAWGMPTWPPATGTVTYDITIKNTSMPAQTITIPGGQLQDFVVEGIGTPPFTRTFVSATCTLSNNPAICAGFNSGLGGGDPSPLGAPFPATATQFKYTFYGQSDLGWRNKSGKPLPLAFGDFVTIRIAFNYYGPDCDTVPNVTPKLIDNQAQITYMATVVGAASGSPQNVQYTQVAIAHTQMKPQQPCKFVVTKSFHPGSPKTVQFGGPPLVYDVTFTNNDVSRTIGTVMDAVRITDAAYATQVPFTSSWTCTQTGGVTPLPGPVPPVNGTAIYTNSPAQGSPVFQFSNLHFNNGAQLSCTVTITVNRPLPNNPHCSMNPANWENAALMDVTHPYNTNVPWPPFPIYNPTVLSNPTPQVRNWATLQAPLPKCYNANINKGASVSGITTNAWTSPNGPAVNYAVTVTNTGTSGTLTGGVPPLPSPGWNGLRVEDAVSPPYNNNPLATGASCPGTWCTLLKPGATSTSPSPSYAGVLSLPPSTPGVWNLTLLPTPPFTAGTYIKNCAVVTPEGTFTGPDYYPNYDPANPPPPACVQVPVLPTAKLGATKKIVNETGHAINFPPTTSGVHVTCQPYPLLSSGNLALTVGAAPGLPNGGSVSGPPGFILNVPISLVPAETCTVTEPTLPAIPPGACGRDTVAYWDTTILPAQPMAITAGPSAVTVTNTLRCRPNLIVTKTFVDATGSPIPIQPPTFNVQVTCSPLAISATNLALTPAATATSSSAQGIVQNVPVGSGETCTVTEPVLPPIPPAAQRICDQTAYWASSPAFAPSQTIPILATGPYPTVTVTNTLRCKTRPFGTLSVQKTLTDNTAIPLPAGTLFPMTVTCGPPALTQSFSLAVNGVHTVNNIPSGSTCTVVETLPALPANLCPGTVAVWDPPPTYTPPNVVITGTVAPIITVHNSVRCEGKTGSLIVKKQVINDTPIGLPSLTFPVTVTCGGTVTHLNLVDGGAQTVSNIPLNTSCSVVEGIMPTPPHLCPGSMKPVWTTVYAPPSPTTITGTGITELMKNTLTCSAATTCTPPQVANAAGACVCPPPMVPPAASGVAAGAACTCPSGTTLVAGKCEPSPKCTPPFVANAAGNCACPPPMVPVGAAVVTGCACPSGMVMRGNACVQQSGPGGPGGGPRGGTGNQGGAPAGR